MTSATGYDGTTASTAGGLALDLVAESPTTPAAPARQHAPRATAGLLAIGTVLAGVLNYVFALILTHGLSTRQFTVFAGAQSLLVINGLIGSAGVPWVLAKETAAAGDDEAQLATVTSFALWANVTYGLVTGTVVGLVALVFASPLDGLLIMLTTLVLSVGSTGIGALQGQGRTARIAGIAIGEVVIKIAIGAVLVLIFKAGPEGALVGFLAGSFVLLLSASELRGRVRRPRRRSSNGRLWRSALRIGSLQVAVGILTALDTLMVASIGSTRAGGGGWQVASAIGKVPLFVSMAVSMAVFPSLAAGEGGRGRQRALRSYLLVAGACWMILLTVPHGIIRVAFPSSYGSVSSWLPFAAALGVALGLMNVLITFIQSEGFNRRAMVLVVGSVVAELGAAVLGAAVGGLRGLAIGVVAVAWLTVLGLAALPTVRPVIPGTLSWLRSWKTLVGSGAIVLTLVLSRRVDALWCLSVVVVMAAVLVRAFPEFDRRPSRLRKAGGRPG